MCVIKFENIGYIYPRSSQYALEGINLSVMEGEFLALMGENGAGKTTFCRLINGIIPHLSGGDLSGNVTVDGLNTNESSVPQLALKVGMVLDDPEAQLFSSTVRGEAAFGPENILLPAEEIKQRVEFALSSVGLNGFENRAPVTLSSGEKQRLSIAAALAMKGKILVLDEPLCRLDPQGIEEVMSVLKEIRKEQKITIIMAAHESSVMAEYADRVCILKNGKIAALDTAKNIFENCDLLEKNGIQPLTNRKEFTTNLSNTHEPVVRNLSNVRVGSCGSWLKNSVIDVSNFSFNYGSGNTIIQNINLTIYDNDFIAIIGNNGCGKTTLLKSITGLLRPVSGDIYIRGKNTKDLSVCDISNEAGFVMQNPDAQLFTDSVSNDITFALKNKRLSKTLIKQRVEDVLKIVDMDMSNSVVFPHALNRADRKKTVVACILAMECKIIIFDEIDTGLDYQGSKKIMDITRDLHSKGFTIIFVTHNMSLVSKYAQRLVKMDRNGIQELSLNKDIT